VRFGRRDNGRQLSKARVIAALRVRHDTSGHVARKEALSFKCNLSASAMRNTGKPRKEGTQINAEVTHPVNRQNCSGDTNHEEALILLVCFSFICTVKATVIADVIRRASILESRLIGSSSHCRRNILLTDWRGRSQRTHGNFLLASEHLRIPLAPRHLDYPRIVLAKLPCRPPRFHFFRKRPRTIWRTG
jgi:hypothetical protein